MQSGNAHSQRPPLVRLWNHAVPHRPRILQACTFSVLNKAFDLAPPFLIGVAVDTVVAQQDSILADVFGIEGLGTQLWVLAAVTFVVWGLESLTEYIFQLLWRNLAQQIQHELRVEAYDHVQGLEMAYFEDRSTGGLMSVMNDDVNQLERFLDVGANDIIQLVTTVVLLGVFFFVVAPSIAWIAFLPIPVIVWFSLRFQKRMAPRYGEVREEVGILNAQLSNNLSGITTIKSFTAEAAETGRISRASDRYRLANREAIRLSSAFVPLIRMAIVMGFIATLVLGGNMALAGTLSVGIYSTLVFMTQRLLWPLTRLGQTFDLYQRAMASTRRIFRLLDVQPGMADGERGFEPAQVRGELALERVSFRYTDDDDWVLRDVDLRIDGGRTTAVVGATGAGKSTLIKLLMRFYDPQEGRVALDGHDLRDLRLRDVRRAIGFVSQDVYLFHGTVRENLVYGNPDATDAQIRHAADVAEAWEFIERLPQGLETIVGERGQKLSGGQRQRIAIARAVLKDPPVLILDEATSAVDNETEAAIQRSLERISMDRTAVVIAHRLSTVRNADRIYVMEDGRVAEVGRHEDLLAENGIYAALWGVQTGERGPAVLRRAAGAAR